MSRDDLAALTIEALTHSTNAGLVKRAARELAGGYRPEIEEAADGTLIARFADGISTTWPRDKAIDDTACTCGPARVCRHRVIVALVSGAGETKPEIGSPARASEADLQAFAPAVREAATRERQRGLVVEVRTQASGEPAPTARLPSATVRYWGGERLSVARCDCVAGQMCEHVLLGVWAFREGAARLASEPIAKVELGERRAQVRGATPWMELMRSVAWHGVRDGATAHSIALSKAHEAAHAGSQVWIGFLLEELEAWLEGYGRRSAAFDPDDGVRLLGELVVRMRAGATGAEVSSAVSELDRARLVCLGCRIRRDDEARRADLILADLDSGTRFLLRHGWKEARDAVVRVSGAQKIAPGVKLAALAQGQLLASGAKRFADGTIKLAKSMTSRNQLFPQSAGWEAFGRPVRFEAVAELAMERRASPVMALRPRIAAPAFVVLPVQEVEGLAYDAGTQSVVARVIAREGDAYFVRRSHEAHLPDSLDALAAALSGMDGKPRFTAGELAWRGGVPVLEPWAIAADRSVVLDIEPGRGALQRLPTTHWQPGADSLAVAAIEEAARLAARLLHHGIAQLPEAWIAEARQLANRLSTLGLPVLQGRVSKAVASAAAARASPGGVEWLGDIADWLADLALHRDAAALESLAEIPAAA